MSKRKPLVVVTRRLPDAVETRMRDFGKAMSAIGSTGLKLSAGLAGLATFPVKMAADPVAQNLRQSLR